VRRAARGETAPAPIRDARGLLLQELRTALRVELTLADETLPGVLDAVRATDLQRCVERHLHETREQARALRALLAHLEEPTTPAEESPALAALTAERDALLRALPGEDDTLRDLVHAAALAQVEHHELASYTSLVHLAQALGLGLEVVTPLRELQEQEAHALEQVEHAVVKLLAEKVEAVG
jgi:ferritin-like metal-binding protein YciE